jgi:hypothetical protein
MRNYIKEQLADGKPCPTAQELVDVIGRPIGLAIDILSEFPEYNPATRDEKA